MKDYAFIMAAISPLKESVKIKIKKKELLPLFTLLSVAWTLLDFSAEAIW
jgi:hypothetical protein